MRVVRSRSPSLRLDGPASAMAAVVAAVVVGAREFLRTRTTFPLPPHLPTPHHSSIPVQHLLPSRSTPMSASKRIRGVSVYRPIIYGNTTVLIDPEDRGASDHTHRWTIAVRSPPSPNPPKRAAEDHIGGADDIR